MLLWNRSSSLVGEESFLSINHHLVNMETCKPYFTSIVSQAGSQARNVFDGRFVYVLLFCAEISTDSTSNQKPICLLSTRSNSSIHSPTRS